MVALLKYSLLFYRMKLRPENPIDPLRLAEGSLIKIFNGLQSSLHRFNVHAGVEFYL